MLISFNYFLKNPFHSLQTKMQLTAQQIVIAKIVLTIFSAFSTVYFYYKLDHLRQHVTVIDPKEGKIFTHIKHVNGNCKVIFNGLFASCAEAKGFFVNGQLNGQGKITFPSGVVSQEEGNFQKGWLSHGKMTYRDGKVEQGSFTKGCLHGKGIRTYLDGRSENGLFINGKNSEPT